MITRSEHGIALFNPDRSDHPAQVHDVRDVTGAGDTVIASLATGLGSGMAIQDAVFLSCKAAGIDFDGKDAHSALYDTQKTAELFCHILNSYPMLSNAMHLEQSNSEVTEDSTADTTVQATDSDTK